MNTAAGERERPPPSPLAVEMRTSALLLGGAFGSIGLLAAVLLLLTHWLAG
ncbi:MAG: hypothetical protein QOI54_3487 [Actinomycetota bacterium]|jgi:hypothetical protein|nr:hypothetical protein [Actinomycetota bacterium]